jgi:hypothetical protein
MEAFSSEVITSASAAWNGLAARVTVGTSMESVVNIELFARSRELVFRVQRHWN